MHRRDFLRMLLATPIAMQLDVEKLLWVPGEKKIFILNKPLTESQIVEIEWDVVSCRLRELFVVDDTFYKIISHKIKFDKIEEVKGY